MDDAVSAPTEGAPVIDRADAPGEPPAGGSLGDEPSQGVPVGGAGHTGPRAAGRPGIPNRPGAAGQAGPGRPPVAPVARVDLDIVKAAAVGAGSEGQARGDGAADGTPGRATPGDATDGSPGDATDGTPGRVTNETAGGATDAPAGGRPEQAAGGRRTIRAGRDLPAAIAVGVALGAVILVPLFTLYPIWVAVVSAAIALGTYEVVRALHVAGMSVPLVPLAAGAVAMPVAAYTAGTNGLVLALAGTTLAAVTVRALSNPAPAGEPQAGPARLPNLPRDAAAAVFTSAYVGFPAGFATLLTSAPDGHWRTIAFLGTVVASDIGGYTAGVLSGGRHKLAPSVSPGKSWEGFGGSVLACVLVASVLMAWPLGAEVWQGALLGAAVACTATVGDLGESLLKRDIGIKDMGNLLPGHGGIMDRLDSLLCTAPVAWLLITAFLD